jgi:sugar diacid utilization regulator
LVREGDPLVAVIGGRPGFGTIELEMPTAQGQGMENANFALQCASVTLGLLKAHAAAMSEMENRLSRDLLEDLFDGIPGEVAIDRAAAQGHDLRVPHDLVVSKWSSDTDSRTYDHDVDRIRTAMAHQRLPCLVTRNQGMVVVLAHHGVDIGRLYDDLCRAHGDTDGVIAKGESISSPEHIPRAYEQAQRALTTRQQSRDPRGFIAYSDLGVERILALTATLLRSNA